MDFSIILEHPNSEEIIYKLVNGTSPKDVYQWLKLKYPNKDQGHLRIQQKKLQEFVNSGFTDCYEQFKNDLTIVKSSDGKLDKKTYSSLLNRKSYRERLQEIADKELDIKSMLQSFINVCRDRAEQVFDKIQQNPESIKVDRVFLEYMKELFNMVEKFDRIVNNAPDQIIQHNITLQAVETNTNAILEAIRKTLSRLDTNFALLFMDMFYDELKSLKAPEEEIMTQDQRYQEAKILQEKITSVSEADDFPQEDQEEIPEKDPES